MKSIGEERLKNVLGGDKKQNPEKIIKIILRIIKVQYLWTRWIHL